MVTGRGWGRREEGGICARYVSYFCSTSSTSFPSLPLSYCYLVYIILSFLLPDPQFELLLPSYHSKADLLQLPSSSWSRCPVLLSVP